MKRKRCCWLARNPRLQGSEELNVVLSGLQNGGPAVALLVNAEMQVISKEVLVSLNVRKSKGASGSRLLPVGAWSPPSWGIHPCCGQD